ncbi:hypothetical protein Q5752_004234 [Cryptotrichosporon argae]
MAQTAKARARQRGRELAAAQAERRARIRAAYSPATVLSSDDHDIGSSSVDISPFVRSAPAPVEPSFSGPPLEPATPKKPKVDRSREGILVGIETRGSPMEQRALRRVLSVLEDETE